jgi:hypothetical protein
MALRGRPPWSEKGANKLVNLNPNERFKSPLTSAIKRLASNLSCLNKRQHLLKVLHSTEFIGAVNLQRPHPALLDLVTAS